MGKRQQLKDAVKKWRGSAKKTRQIKRIKTTAGIGFKIGSGYVTLAVLVLTSGLFSLYQMNQMQKNSQNIINQNIPALDKIHNMNYLTEHVMAISMQHILTSNPAEKGQLEEERTQDIRLVAETLKSYKLTLNEGEELEQFQSLSDKWSEFMAVNNQAIKLSGSNDKELALEVSRKGISAFNSMQKDLEALVKHSQEEAAKEGEKSVGIYHTSLTVNIITVVIVLLVIGLINTMIRKWVISPLKKVTAHLQDISDGNLTAEETRISSKDEIGQLADTVNETNRTLLEMVNRIRTVSEVIAEQGDELMHTISETKEGSSQIALTMEELAKASGSQAEAAVDASKSIEELNALIENFAVRGKALSEHSEQVWHKGEKGQALMESSVAQMNQIAEMVSQSMSIVEELNRKNEGIFQLVGSIRSISEQTHLLAINAAIEAARAGDSGRGFAVVAQEVRKLSEDVQRTVSDITVITQGIQHDSKAMVEQLRGGVAKTEEGSRQIVETGEALAEINSSVGVMAATVDEMGKDLQHMTEASETMNEFSQHISALAEESAAGVEETSASAHEQLGATSEVAEGISHLKNLLSELKDSVSRFKV